MLFVDWDVDKNAENIERHCIGFEEAADVFDDPFHLTAENLEFEGEQRYDVVGSVISGAILHVTYIDWVQGFDIIARIISARKATRRERRGYEQDRKTSTRHTP